MPAVTDRLRPGEDLDLVVSTHHVRVWISDLDRQRDDAADLELLSEDERVRAARFHFDVHRRRFVACRSLLRRLVAAELGTAPQDVSFQYGPFGKPALAGESELKFNVSHSDRYALLGFTRGRDVGIDIERVRTLANLDHLAERVFSPAEQEEFSLVPPASRAEAFFSGWTRKEAYIKARGDGLQRLADFDVSLGPGEPVRLRRVQAEPEEPARWSLMALAPVPGFAAAVCVEDSAIRRLR